MRKLESRFGEWVLAARWPIIILSLILVAVAASGGRFLKVASDYRVFFSADNPQLLAFEALERTYTKLDNVLYVIVPESGDFASEEALQATVWVTERAWQTPYSTRVDSVANFQHTTAGEDDLWVRDLVDPDLIGDSGAREEIRTAAFGDPRLFGRLLAKDGALSAVNATVQLPGENETVEVPEVAAFARTLAAEAEEEFPGVDVRLLGMVVVNNAFTEASLADMKTLIPISFVLMALVLAVLLRGTRGLVGVVATAIVIILSVVTALGLAGWIGFRFSPPTATAPTIILTVAVANCVHVLVTMLQRLRAGDDKRAAIVESLRVNLHPVFLASLTTALGFLTMNFSEVPPYRQLGTMVAFGIGTAFVLSVTFMPAVLSLLPLRAPALTSGRDTRMTALADFVVRNRTVLLWGSVAVVAVLLASVPRNQLNDVFLHYFDESTSIRQDVDFIDTNLVGTTGIEYSIASSGPGGIMEPAFLADVAAFAEWFRSQPETDHVGVITDTFRQLNQSMHADDPAAYILPESRDLAAQYLLLYEMSLPFGLDLNNQIDVDKSAIRMSVVAKTMSSQEVLEFNDRALAWQAENTPNIRQVDGTGTSLMFSHIGQRNIRAMLIGTTAALLGISLLMIVALRSVRIGLVSLIPNFVPGVMGFGIWGLTVGEVGLALAVVTTMTLGIVVDDTVHFLSKYQRARREHGYAPPDAVRYAFQTVGRALITTTAVLVVGFLVLSYSTFLPNSGMGLLTALIIGLALVADFLLLPPLLMAVDRGSRNPAPAGTAPAPA